MKSFNIGNHSIGLNKPCFIIGEVAQAHDGSLGMAHAFIDAIADAKADAVKFQTHIADAESSPGESWRTQFSQQDSNRYQYWKRMEFTEEQWIGLKFHAEKRGLKFISSPFSTEAVNLLSRAGIDAWKIASGELSNTLLLKQIASKHQPVLISTGMSSLNEIDTAVNLIKQTHTNLAILQCTTAYPCPPEKIGLNLIPFFQQRYNCAVGLSDHSGTIYPGFAATTIGIQILEVHITLSREMFGPDVPASITTSELRQLVEGIRFIETMKSNHVDKDQISQEMDSIRRIFTKSVFVRNDLPKGTILKEEHLTIKKPGTGIPASQFSSLIGRCTARPLKASEMLSESDLV